MTGVLIKFGSHSCNIGVLTTGGTIDKSFDEQKGRVVNQASNVKQLLLPLLRLPFTRVELVEVMAKDSLYFTTKDRAHLYDAILKNAKKYQALVVLHGTDTMDCSVEFCVEQGGVIAVPVVFTGAFRPAGFAKSDALQNFTNALLCARILEAGFYMVCHGALYQGATFKKDKAQGTFKHNLER